MDYKSDTHKAEAMRRFNRFYTKHIGALHEGLAKSSFSLTEVRVMYELAHRNNPTAAELARQLGLDTGYLSRLLTSFERRGLIARRPSDTDGRQHYLFLTDQGRAAFAPLDRVSLEEVGEVLKRLSPADQERLLAAMRTIERLIDARARPGVVVLREPRAGDLGWIVHRHALLHTDDFGWDRRVEGCAAQLVADYVNTSSSRRVRAWIAERDNDIVGNAMVLRHDDEVAKVCLLYVEPVARGFGIGDRLLDDCLRFARHAGYRKVILDADPAMVAAQRLCLRKGFTLAAQCLPRMEGELLAQRWERDLL
jgi:DNA-binding MarR family transcriptional regulator/N-acetylglutamate synthase-like GNAT family acetyltransferase